MANGNDTRRPCHRIPTKKKGSPDKFPPEHLWELTCVQELELAELHEKQLAESNNLPSDPIDVSSSEMNIMKISFVFMLRRLAVHYIPFLTWIRD